MNLVVLNAHIHSLYSNTLMLLHVRCAFCEAVSGSAKFQWLRDSKEKLLHLEALYLLPDVHCWFLHPRPGLSDSYDRR